MSDMPRQTLDRLSGARNYNRWLFERFRPFAGRRLLEVGCGTGNMTGHFVSCGALMASDVDPGRVEAVRRLFADREDFRAAVWDVSRPAPDEVVRFRPDTVICLNILEHVAADAGALANMRAVLPPGGRLLLFVPALPALFGSLDRELDHVRRYGRAALERRTREAGFAREAGGFMNMPGVAGWWLNSRLLRRREFSPVQIAIYDRLVPAIARCERLVRPPFGQSLFYVGRRVG